jgi:hypothetical protein
MDTSERVQRTEVLGVLPARNMLLADSADFGNVHVFAFSCSMVWAKVLRMVMLPTLAALED